MLQKMQAHCSKRLFNSCLLGQTMEKQRSRMQKHILCKQPLNGNLAIVYNYPGVSSDHVTWAENYFPVGNCSRHCPNRYPVFVQKGNVSDLPAAEVLTLGPLVCELDPAWISSLNSAALNSTLQALASCQYIQQQHRENLFRLLTGTYG